MNYDPLTELGLVLTDTNSLAVREQERAKLVEALTPIAGRLAEHCIYANQLTIATAAEAESAAIKREAILNDSQNAETALRGFDSNLIERLFKLHRRWTGFLNVFKEPLDDAAKTVKRKIIDWQEAEAEKARKEQERLQAIADEKARKERERLHREASRLKTPEKIQERLEAAAAILPAVVSVRPTEMANAPRTQKRWKVVNVDMTTFVAAVNDDKTLQGFVGVNVSALEKAKAANSKMEVGGVTFEHRTI